MRPQSRFLAAPLLGITGSGKARPCRPGRGDLLRMTGRRCRSFDRWSPCVAFSHHQVPASHGPLEAAERRYSGPRKGQGFQPRPRVSTFGFTAGPQLTAALSQGRGYGEAGDEGLFCSAKPADPSPTASRSPSPQAGEGYCQLIFRRQAKCTNSKAGFPPFRSASQAPLIIILKAEHSTPFILR